MKAIDVEKFVNTFNKTFGDLIKASNPMSIEQMANTIGVAITFVNSNLADSNKGVDVSEGQLVNAVADKLEHPQKITDFIESFTNDKN